MKQIILQVLEELKDSQINLQSESAREDIAEELYKRLDKYVVDVLELAMTGE
jgi:hypothetical protein